MSMRFATAIASLIGLFALSFLTLSGCHSPRGGFMPASFGSTTYHSTETQPKSITIIDTRTGEEFFHMDIPPGKQLTLNFVADGGDDPVMTPDLMRYQVFDLGTRTGRLRNSMTVPNAASRRIDMNIRPGIEYAERPAEERLRTDELEDRPDWWTPDGGPRPEENNSELYDR